mmetsp:Transcript_87780/g.200619  ORF Transcript_87780/g.200619 Transcript_87780/m.200619 type:complete len:112 (+) Transcript_87780:3-338(+)
MSKRRRLQTLTGPGALNARDRIALSKEIDAAIVKLLNTEKTVRSRQPWGGTPSKRPAQLRGTLADEVGVGTKEEAMVRDAMLEKELQQRDRRRRRWACLSSLCAGGKTKGE